MSTYSIVIGPYFVSGYITDDYVLDGSLAAAAAITTTGDTLTVKDAAATLSASFGLDQRAGLLIEVNEIIPYTWDDVYGNWDSWPGAHWEYRGVRLQAFDQVNLNTLNTIFQGVTSLSAQFSFAANGTLMRYGEVSAITQTALTAVGQVTYAGQTAVTSAFTLTTTGLRIQEIASTLFDNVALTTLGTVIWSGESSMNTSLTTQATSYVLWNGDPETFAVVATADFDSNLFIRNLENVVAFPITATLAQAITLAKTDPYRALVITPENRICRVLVEPRSLDIAVNTRLAQVVAETRALEIEQANRVLKLNIPPFKQIVNERQI